MSNLSSALLEQPKYLFFFLGCLLVFVGIFHAVYFYVRYQRKLDKQFMRDNYYSGGFLFDVSRLSNYAMFILFPGRTKDKKTQSFFKNLEPKIKTHLLFHYFVMFIGVISLFTPIVLTYF
ncbi:hypothetical protein [Kangiella spongicola]|uniref:Uncharacterized protein n=1 Tax=Kangiella spongicola TaxID=796379 RepID=A0A318D8J2_9GAMM|nr:hypothetical protein [Kangiella spongicola]PXF64225.1 hypothetical protein DL796_03565 [Kangiella spongicola]